MRRALPLFFLLSLLLAACGDPRIALSYRLEEGRSLEYRLTLVADISRTLEGRNREQRVQAAFRLGQQIIETLPEGARARMSLVPLELFVDRRSEPVGEPQEFIVTLGPAGEIVALDEAVGAVPEPLELVGIERLLPRLRPVLPEGPVEQGDEWSATTELRDEDGSFSLEARSRLAELGRTAGTDTALVRTIYASPVDRREVLANAVAEIEGRDVGTQEAWFSLGGLLIRASGDSVGRYRVSFSPPRAEGEIAPVAGRLVVRLHTELELIAGGPEGLPGP